MNFVGYEAVGTDSLSGLNMNHASGSIRHTDSLPENPVLHDMFVTAGMYFTCIQHIVQLYCGKTAPGNV